MNPLALITGGTKGIGLSVAKRLLHEGYDVVLTYHSDTTRAGEVAAQLREKYPSQRIDVLQADISDLNTINLIDGYLEEHRLMPATVIFNAGLTDRTPFMEMDIDSWKRIFDANVHFPVFLIQKIYHRIQPGGSIIFTGSLMGVHQHAMSLVYGVTKSTVHSLVKNLVKFVVDRQIRVNAVAPGFADTEWQTAKPQAVKDSINQKIAAGRFCHPDELADVYWMLINNRYMNGEVVVVDGGYLYK